MSQETCKIYATKSCEVNTRFEVNTEKKEILYSGVFSSYSETPYVGFDIDISSLPDTVNFCFYADNSEYSKITRANGYWDETTRIYNMPGYTSSENDQKIVLGLNTLENVPKSCLANGFVIYRYENGGPTYIYSTRYSDEGKRPYIEYVKITPEINEFTVVGSSIDAPISCSWNNVDVESLLIQVIQNGNIVYSKEGTSETCNCDFAVGTFSNSGLTTFKIIARHGNNTVEVSKDVELTKTVPQIISIEPNGILKLFTNPIDIEFTGTNITSFVVNAYQDNVKKFTFSGTTERKIPVLANVFTSGTVTIEVIANYKCATYETTTTRTVSFIAYGPPPKPVLNVDEEYHTPFPLIKWKSLEQLAYQLKIDAIDTGEIYSNDMLYQVNAALQNHTYYQVSLRIKNQYKLWSDWVTATIYIDFAEVAQPEFNIYADNSSACIVLNIQSPEDSNFNYHELYRKEKDIWVKVATDIGRVAEYRDYACASNTTYEYKVRAITTVGGYTDSVVKAMQCNFKGNIISIPFTDISFNVRYTKEESGIQKSTTFAVDRKFVVYCGCDKPKETRGMTNYRQFSLSTTFRTRYEYLEFEKILDERVVLFRDCKGVKAYCSLSITGMTDEKSYYATADLALTEVYYKEGDYSEAESRPLQFVDEEW